MVVRDEDDFVNPALLADSIDPAGSLLQSCRAPWELVMNHQPAPWSRPSAQVQVQALRRRVRCQQEPAAVDEIGDRRLPLPLGEPAMKAPHGVTCGKDNAVQLLERVAKFGEYQHRLTDTIEET